MDDSLTGDDTLDWGGEETKDRVLGSEVFREPVSLLCSREPIGVEAGVSVSDAIATMAEHRIGCLLVTQGERLVGIFTERDVIRRVLGEGREPARTTVDEVMTPDPETLPIDAEISWAVNRMSLGGYRHVPLLGDGDRPVGIVSVKDLLDYLAEFFPEIQNIPPRPGLEITRDREGG